MGDIGRKRKNFEKVSTRPGNRSLLLGEVLFPLRYDIYVMAEYLDFYEKNKDKGHDWLLTNIPEYMQQRTELVHDLRREWALIGDMPDDKWKRRKDKYNQANVKVLIELWEDVRKRGFLGTGEGHFGFKVIADESQTYEGHIPPRGSLYLTNGQHRMVVLLAMGKTGIPPEWYNVVTVRNFEPIETTHEYIKRGWISEAEFVSFARLRFPQIPEEIVTVRDFSKWAHDTDQPGWLYYYLKVYWGTAC